MIDRDIERLSDNFKKKLKAFLNEANNKWHAVVLFEWLRTKDRQRQLYNQWRTTPWKIVTWTMKSNHLTGNAADIVFMKNWNYSWEWNYDALIEIAKKYWIRNLKPTETAHFEDDWTIYNIKEEIMWEYSKLVWYNIFSQNEDDYKKPATIWDIKDLLEGAIYRYNTKKEDKTLKIR